MDSSRLPIGTPTPKQKQKVQEGGGEKVVQGEGWKAMPVKGVRPRPWSNGMKDQVVMVRPMEIGNTKVVLEGLDTQADQK